MGVAKANLNGNPNIGLYGYCTDEMLLLGEQPTELARKEMERALGVPVALARIAGTSMTGVFLVGNSTAVLVPAIAFEAEIARLRKLGLTVTVLETIHTCLGNNIVCNDHGAIVSTEFSEAERERISAALGVPVVAMDIAGISTPGALVVVNGAHGIIHRDATQEEVAKVEKALNVTLSPATTNLGTPYLKAAILHNTKGFAIGDASGGPEIVHIEEALGYQ